MENFTKEEIKRFEKFLNSPYFNNGRNYKQLWKIIKNHLQKFTYKELTEEIIFRKLYPCKVYEAKSSVSLRVMLSNITSLVKKFLAIEGLEAENGQQLLSRSLRFSYFLKGMYDEAELESFEALKIIKTLKLNDPVYESLFYVNQHIASAYQFKDEQIKGSSMNKMIIVCNIASLFTRLSQNLNNIINSKKRYNIQIHGLNTISSLINSFDIKTFNEEFPDDEFGSKEYVELYYSMCKSMINDKDDESMLNSIRLFEKNNNRLGNPQGIYTRLHNILRTRAYELNYEKYGRMNNELSEFVLKNIYLSDITSGKNLRSVAFASIFEFKVAFMNNKDLTNFIKTNIPLIMDDSKEHMKNYANAWLFFKQKNFEKALESISIIRLVDDSFKDDIYKLKLAIFVELGFADEALSLVDAYEHYLNSNKNVSGFIKTRGKSFTSGIKYLLKNNKDSSDHDGSELISRNKNSLFGKWFETNFKNKNPKTNSSNV